MICHDISTRSNQPVMKQWVNAADADATAVGVDLREGFKKIKIKLAFDQKKGGGSAKKPIC